MLPAQDLFPDRQRALEKGLGLLVFTLAFVEQGQVIDALSQVGVFGTQYLFPDRQRALVKRLSLLVFAFGSVKRCQVN